MRPRIVFGGVAPLRAHGSAVGLRALYPGRSTAPLSTVLDDTAMAESLAAIITAHIPTLGTIDMRGMARAILVSLAGHQERGAPHVPITLALVDTMASQIDRGIAATTAGTGTLDTQALAVWLMARMRAAA